MAHIQTSAGIFPSEISVHIDVIESHSRRRFVGRTSTILDEAPIPPHSQRCSVGFIAGGLWKPFEYGNQLLITVYPASLLT